MDRDCLPLSLSMLVFEFNFIGTHWVFSVCNTHVIKYSCVRACECVRVRVCFLCFSFWWKHFILWALRTKLETHETIFAMTLGKDIAENKNSLAATVHLCSAAKRQVRGTQGRGELYLWLSHWKRDAVPREWVSRQKMPCGRVGGWVQRTLLAFLTYP